MSKAKLCPLLKNKKDKFSNQVRNLFVKPSVYVNVANIVKTKIYAEKTSPCSTNNICWFDAKEEWDSEYEKHSY